MPETTTALRPTVPHPAAPVGAMRAPAPEAEPAFDIRGLSLWYSARQALHDRLQPSLIQPPNAGQHLVVAGLEELLEEFPG